MRMRRTALAGLVVALTLVSEATAVSGQSPTPTHRAVTMVSSAVAQVPPEQQQGASADVAAAVLGKRISLTLENIPVAQALKRVAEVAEISISFGTDAVGTRLVSLDAKNVELDGVLRQLLRGTAVRPWVSKHGQIALVPAIGVSGTPRSERGELPAEDGRITGTVIDAATSRPLAGAQVTVSGALRGTMTGADGRYVIADLPAGSYTVQASMLGYTAGSKTVTVVGGQAATADFQLSAAAVELEGIVAIGYGTTLRKDLTGSVATVDQKEIARVPTNDVREALQGKVPGMDIVRNGGSPNSGVSIDLRGVRSLTASNSPLVIVDGNQFGDLSDLDTHDIESIQVLKDASSTAIYGSRGANGVIIVTTKKGSGAHTGVSINSYVGMTHITAYPRINTGPEYVAQRREANRAAGLWSSPEDDAKIFSPLELQAIQSGTWTDFRSLLFHDGLAQNHQIGLSTGDDNTKAYLSAAVYDEQGTLTLDDLRRYTLRMNLDRTLGKAWTIGTNSQVTYYDTNERRNPFNMANKISPLTSAYDSAGAVAVHLNNGRDISPLADEQPNAYRDNTLTSHVLPSLYAQWAPLAGFSIRSTLAADLVSWREGYYASPNTIDRNGNTSLATVTNHNSRDVSWDNVATWKRTLGANSLELTGITSYLRNRMDESSASGENQLLSSQLFYGLGNTTQGVAVNSRYVESELLSYAGRVNYGFRDRYLLTLTGRFDGSSRLSPGRQWAFFPSVAAAWRISDEPFLRHSDRISDLKLRLSYGVSGNDAVAPYSTQGSLTKIPFAFEDAAAAGYTFSSRLGNEDLKWEMSATSNLGLDFGLWNNRVAGSLDLYRTNTSNLLLQRFLPYATGASSVMQNIGKTRNEGVELALNTVNLEGNRLSWRSAFTFATNKEQIVQLVNGSDDLADGWFIGYPADVFYDYQKLGIWQTADSAQAASFGQKPGSISVKDSNGDGKITAEDRVILGSPRPKWSGSMINTLTIGDLDFSASVFARIGQLMQYEFYGDFKPDGIENGAHVDYWTPENPSNDFPRPNSGLLINNLPYYSSLTYADGSFIKLSNVTLGYTLPESFSSRIASNRLRLYLTGKSLAWWSKVDNYDPERGGSLSTPMTRLVVVGVDASF